MEKLIKIGRDLFKNTTYKVNVEVSPPDLKSNEFRCDDCGNVYEKGWSDEEASAESQAAFGITIGSVVCDDCYNKFMYNRAVKISTTDTNSEGVPTPKLNNIKNT